MKSPKISVISCSSNPDMVYYFQIKKQAVSDAIYLGPSICAHTSLLHIACFSHKNGFSLRLFFDVLWGLVQSLRLKFFGVTHVLFDNVHIANVAYGIFFKILRIKQIHTIHDRAIHPGSNARVTELYYQYFCRLCADEYVFFSNGLFVFDPDKKGHVLKLCGFEQYDKQTTGGRDVLFFGRIQPYKGVEHLEAIADFLGDQYPQSRLIVMGSGDSPYLSNLDERANVELHNRYFSKEELIAAAEFSAVTVVPYTSATQSGVMIESYSLGLPVVFFDVGCLSEYCPSDIFGRPVALGDVDQFNRCVADYIDDSASASQRLLASFESMYGLTAFHEQYRQLIKRLT